MWPVCLLVINNDHCKRLEYHSRMESVGDSLGATERGPRREHEVNLRPPQVADSTTADPPLRPLPSPPLLQQTLPLVRHLLLWTMDPSGGHRAPSDTAEALEATARDLTSRFGATLAHMAVTMEATEGPVASTRDVERTLRAVADRMFEDRVTNWGRLVSVVVFAGMLARRAARAGVALDADELAQAVSRYLLEARGTWMSAHGGWDGCVSHLRRGVGGPEGALWGSLLGAVGVGIGIGLLVTTWGVLRGL